MNILKDKNCALVVTYDRPLLLLRCLDSLMKQSKQLNGIIIVDNGSDSKTPKLLRKHGFLNIDFGEFAEKDFFANVLKDDVTIHYLRFSQNKGPGFAFFSGVEYFVSTDNDWLWMMDDDGAPHSNCLERLSLHKEKADFLNPIVLDEDNKDYLAFGLYCKKNGRKILNLADVLEVSENGLINNTANPFNGTFISRDLVNKIGFPMHELYGWGVEVEYELRSLKMGFRVASVSDAYHYHPKSRVEQVSVFFNRYLLNYNSVRIKNYIDFRNSNFLWFNYYGFKSNFKYFLAYTYFFISNFKFNDWLLYLKAATHGIFSIWNKTVKIN